MSDGEAYGRCTVNVPWAHSTNWGPLSCVKVTVASDAEKWPFWVTFFLTTSTFGRFLVASGRFFGRFFGRF